MNFSLEILRALLDELDNASVECDGMCRLVATKLSKAGIPYQAKGGSLAVAGQGISPHFWVEVGPFIIDYRARMWLGEAREDVPHGIFVQGDYPQAQYLGVDYHIGPMDDWLYDILRQPIPSSFAPVTATAHRSESSRVGCRGHRHGG